MLGFFRDGGFAMFPLTVFGVAMLITGVQFARNADTRGLSLIRALTVTISFCTIIGVASGLASTARYVADHPQQPEALFIGFAETMTNVIWGGAFVVLTWILVAVGVRRMPKETP